MQDNIRRVLGLGARPDPKATARAALPVLWLLGKTGAGKSSVLRALTGQAQVGCGFAPCTRTAGAFEFPSDHPVLRFLDTRGLAEAGYDPAEDLATAEAGSHAVLAVARLDDPAQGALAEVLASLRRRRPRLPILVLHTGADLLPDPELCRRARAVMQGRLDLAVGAALPSVLLSLPPDAPPAPEGIRALRAALGALLPDLALLLAEGHAADAEAARFATLRPKVLWYAGAAGASDAAPLVGAVGVPAIQGAMLQALAADYGLRWTPARAAGFASALGGGTLLRVGLSHALRQGAKLVPVLGQSLGGVMSAAVSFAATFALGRAAAFWLFRSAEGAAPDPQALRQIYAAAFRTASDARR